VSTDKKLFVYGTLKRGGANHRWLADQTFVSAARTVPGYRLFELNGFPGMVVFAEDRDGVTGEVWVASQEALQRLDEFEGVDEGLYHREPVRLLRPFENDAVDAYIYPGNITGRRDLGSTWNA
jgi:gamma-glutamylaminecyclotransferase